MKWPDELMFIKNSRLPQKVSTTSMENKWSVISGATSGVGLETARALAAAKSNIIIVCRNAKKAEPIQTELQEKYQVQVNIVVADFADFTQVRQAADYLNLYYPTIDVLINSVGIHSTKKYFNPQGIELCYAVNHLSVLLFTQLLIPSLKSSQQGRIIQVSSEGHRFSKVHLNDINFKRRLYTGLRGYGQSKTAQILSVQALSERLKDTNITINACHPGEVKTAIGSNNGWLYRFFFRHVTSRFLKSPVISGSAIYYLASDPDVCKITGKLFHLTLEEKPAKHAANPILAEKVYAHSCDLVQLSPLSR